jgi:hypothetical protein
LTAPVINEYWFKAEKVLKESEYWNTYYLVVGTIVLFLSLASFYHFLLRTTPGSEARKIMKMIEHDMKHKNYFRNGLHPRSIYEFYSAETNFTRPEFNARVVPVIEQLVSGSTNFHPSTNRTGDKVYKVD